MARISPAVRRAMREEGVTEDEIQATGVDDSITMRDLYRFIGQRVADQSIEAAGLGPDASAWAGPAAAAEEMVLAQHDELSGRAAATAAEKDKRMRARSRPWNSSNSRWKVDAFRVPKKDGFKDRFFRKDRVRDAIELGWRPASKKERQLPMHNVKLPWTQGETDFIERKGMYLMEIPERASNDRDRYFAALTANQSSSAVSKAIAAGAYVRAGDFGKIKRRRLRPVGRQSAQIGKFADDY